MVSKDIVVDMWGEAACFTRPEARVERMSYPIMTPMAAVGVLSAIYSKPVEFYWKVTKIEIMKPIRTQNMKVNEVKSKMTSRMIPIDIADSDSRAQRNMQILKDVKYRVTAHLVPRPQFDNPAGIKRLYSQAIRRLTYGQHYHMPYMGISDFWAAVALSDGKETPQDINMELPMMILDLWTHEISEKVSTTCKACFRRQYFDAKIEHGVMVVPDKATVMEDMDAC